MGRGSLFAGERKDSGGGEILYHSAGHARQTAGELPLAYNSIMILPCSGWVNKACTVSADMQLR